MEQKWWESSLAALAFGLILTAGAIMIGLLTHWAQWLIAVIILIFGLLLLFRSYRIHKDTISSQSKLTSIQTNKELKLAISESKIAFREFVEHLNYIQQLRQIGDKIDDSMISTYDERKSRLVTSVDLLEKEGAITGIKSIADFTEKLAKDINVHTFFVSIGATMDANTLNLLKDNIQQSISKIDELSQQVSHKGDSQN